jgi:hypothetical protein
MRTKENESRDGLVERPRAQDATGQESQRMHERPQQWMKVAVAMGAIVTTVGILFAVFISAGSRTFARPLAANVNNIDMMAESRSVQGQLAALGYTLGGGESSTAAPVPNRPVPADGDAHAEQQTSTGLSRKYLIRTARVVLEVADVDATGIRIEETAQKAGGYLANMDEQTDGLGRTTMTVVVRIPTDKLDGVIDDLKTWGKLLSRNISVQDVSAEYVDTDARSRNMKKTEERLLEHLGQSAAVDSTIKLETELSRVREQIETMDGRLRYLDNQIAYSTIELTLSPTPGAQSIVPADTFSTAQVFSDSVRTLTVFGRGLLACLVWVGVWSVVWVPIMAGLYWAFWRGKGTT